MEKDVFELWITCGLSTPPGGEKRYFGAVTVTRAGRNTRSAMR